MYIFIYYFLIVFKNKTLNTSFLRVENIPFVNKSALIKVLKCQCVRSACRKTYNIRSTQSLDIFSFAFLEVLGGLSHHLIGLSNATKHALV